MRRALLSIAVSAALGCGVNLPPEYLVEDLRVLDVRVTPPEIPLFARTSSGALEFDPDNPPALDPRTVRVEAFVAHPDLEARFSYDWIRCKPGLDNIPCDGDRERLDETPGPELSFVPINELFEDVAAGTPLSELAASLAEDPRDLLNGLYAYVNLTASVDAAAIEVDTAALDATKRIVLFEPRLVATALMQARALDPAQVEQAQQLGLPTLCTHTGDEELAGLFSFLQQREPNRPPLFESMALEVFDRGGTRTSSHTVTSTQARTGTVAIDVPDGGTVTLEASWREGDSESYQLIDSNCELQPFEERLSVSWFTQNGQLSRQTTTREDRATVWRWPEPEDEVAPRARIWAVLRDGRGGSDHLRLDLRLRP